MIWIIRKSSLSPKKVENSNKCVAYEVELMTLITEADLKELERNS